MLDAHEGILDQSRTGARHDQRERDLAGEGAVRRSQPGAHLLRVAVEGLERDRMEVENARESVGLVRREMLAAALAVRERAAREDEARHFIARENALVDDLDEERGRDALGDEPGELELGP